LIGEVIITNTFWIALGKENSLKAEIKGDCIPHAIKSQFAFHASGNHKGKLEL
jgi:hypothetical protein